MKKFLFAFLFIVQILNSYSQYATDFTAQDCSGTVHNLFSELNEGKVIVLVWVMPCGGCAGPSKTTYNVVQKFQASHHPNVFMYVIDDFANTQCASINSWCNANGIPNTLRFSDSKIKMSDYGANGMPKIVVVGGADHKVYYNVNNYVNATDLENAINSAMPTLVIKESENQKSSIFVYPNPSDKTSEISFNLTKSIYVQLDLYDINGNLIKNIFAGQKEQGEHKIFLESNNLSAGSYFIRFLEGTKIKMVNLLIAN